MAFWNRTEPTPPKPEPAPAPAPQSEQPAAAPTTKPTAANSGGPSATANEEVPFLRPSLGSDTSVTGKLSFTAPTRIDGQLKGEVRATDLLLVGEHGSVEGTLQAKSLILEGTVRGDVIGTEWVRVEPTGRLIGSLESGKIDIALGAKVQAEMKIKPLANTKPAPSEPNAATSAPSAGAAQANQPTAPTAQPAGQPAQAPTQQLTLEPTTTPPGSKPQGGKPQSGRPQAGKGKRRNRR